MGESMSNSFEDIQPFTGMELAIQKAQTPAASALTSTDQARAIAEVQAALVIAQSCRRDELVSRDRILRACQRTSLANSAIYSYPRGGQKVSGPSIRLAEVAARSWGNINYGFREINRRVGESEIEAYAWDLETNTKAVRQFAVRHARDKGSASVSVTQERDIYEVIANQAQRRVRSCILEIIPGDIIEEAIEQCERTMQAAVVGKDGKTSLTDIVVAMAKGFEGIGVPKAAIEKRLGHRLDSTQAAEVIGLRKIFASIKDGFSTVQDWFSIDAIEEKPVPTAGNGEDKAKVPEEKRSGPGRTRKSDPATPPPPLAIACPNADGREVEADNCDDCSERKGCPAWEKWDK